MIIVEKFYSNFEVEHYLKNTNKNNSNIIDYYIQSYILASKIILSVFWLCSLISDFIYLKSYYEPYIGN